MDFLGQVTEGEVAPEAILLATVAIHVTRRKKLSLAQMSVHTTLGSMTFAPHQRMKSPHRPTHPSLFLEQLLTMDASVRHFGSSK